MILYPLIAVMAVAEVAARQQIERDWQRRFNEADAAMQQIMLAEKQKRHEYNTAERRHREVCDAIKEAGKRASFWP